MSFREAIYDAIGTLFGMFFVLGSAACFVLPGITQHFGLYGLTVPTGILLMACAIKFVER